MLTPKKTSANAHEVSLEYTDIFFVANGYTISGVYSNDANRTYQGLFFGYPACHSKYQCPTSLIDVKLAASYIGNSKLINRNEIPDASPSNDKDLHLNVIISNDYFQIWANGDSLPKIFYNKEGSFLHNGKIQMSAYSPKDSAYLDANNEFITSLDNIKPGATVSTLTESSARKLACGQFAAKVEDICKDGKLAVTLKPRSVYDELTKPLIAIHNRFIDSPDADNVTILVTGDIDFGKIARVIDRARDAGFFKIGPLAKVNEEEFIEAYINKGY